MADTKEKFMTLEITPPHGDKIVYAEPEYCMGDLLLRANEARDKGYEARFK